jgi:hypothetical protein
MVDLTVFFLLQDAELMAGIPLLRKGTIKNNLQRHGYWSPRRSDRTLPPQNVGVNSNFRHRLK